jgi:hypothetical protein
VMNPPLNQVNHAGCASANAPPAKTQIGKRFVAMARMRFMRTGIKRKNVSEAIKFHWQGHRAAMTGRRSAASLPAMLACRAEAKHRRMRKSFSSRAKARSKAAGGCQFEISGGDVCGRLPPELRRCPSSGRPVFQ